jgi:hypothetical protein
LYLIPQKVSKHYVSGRATHPLREVLENSQHPAEPMRGSAGWGKLSYRLASPEPRTGSGEWQGIGGTGGGLPPAGAWLGGAGAGGGLPPSRASAWRDCGGDWALASPEPVRGSGELGALGEDPPSRAPAGGSWGHWRRPPPSRAPAGGSWAHWRWPPPSRVSAWGGWGENSEGLRGYSQGNSCRSTDSTVDGSVVNGAVNGGGVNGGGVSAGSEVSLQTSPFWD